VHNYVNEHEAKQSLPGCRTVVASGFRQCFEDRTGKEDFFSANLSAAVAFKAQEQGSRAGIRGNRLYLESDVAVATSPLPICRAIMGMSKFERSVVTLVDPFSYSPPDPLYITIRRPEFRAAKPTTLEIMNHDYVFRPLNGDILAHLQLFEDYQRIAATTTVVDTFAASIRDAIQAPTPTTEKVEWDMDTNIFSNLVFTLEADYGEFFQVHPRP
jgi:hypothetical protein